MSTETLWRAQTAIYTLLTQSSALTTLLAHAAAIYDHVPAGSAFPYIVLGDMRAQANDTQQHSGTEIFCTLESHSRKTGQQEIKKIADAIHAVLHHQSPAIAGHITVLCEITNTQVEHLPDTQSWRCRQTLRLLAEPVPL